MDAGFYVGRGSSGIASGGVGNIPANHQFAFDGHGSGPHCFQQNGDQKPWRIQKHLRSSDFVYSMEEIENALIHGEITAAVVIPEGFMAELNAYSDSAASGGVPEWGRNDPCQPGSADARGSRDGDEY